MKKIHKLIFVVCFVVVLAFTAGVYALDASTPDVAPAMSETADESTTEFFTWPVLATYAGALTATVIITQLVKGLGFIAKIPTRLSSWVVALIILFAATAATVGITISSAGLCVINAGVISLAANGGYDLLTSRSKDT